MVRRKHSRRHDRSVGNSLLNINVGWDCGEDAGGADLVEDGSILTEVPGEDVLVVADSDDCLQHKDSRTSNDRVLGAEIGVFPQDSIVLLMTAHDIRQLQWLTRGGVVVSIEVLDGSQAVATKLQVVGVDAGTIIPEIKRGLARIRSTRITVGHKHLAQGKSVEQASAIVANVM